YHNLILYENYTVFSIEVLEKNSIDFLEQYHNTGDTDDSIVKSLLVFKNYLNILKKISGNHRFIEFSEVDSSQIQDRFTAVLNEIYKTYVDKETLDLDDIEAIVKSLKHNVSSPYYKLAFNILDNLLKKKYKAVERIFKGFNYEEISWVELDLKKYRYKLIDPILIILKYLYHRGKIESISENISNISIKDKYALAKYLYL
ncbi:unnamed protein product, partial [marine sediment metagenome]